MRKSIDHRHFEADKGLAKIAMNIHDLSWRKREEISRNQHRAASTPLTFHLHPTSSEVSP